MTDFSLRREVCQLHNGRDAMLHVLAVDLAAAIAADDRPQIEALTARLVRIARLRGQRLLMASRMARAVQRVVWEQRDDLGLTAAAIDATEGDV